VCQAIAKRRDQRLILGDQAALHAALRRSAEGSNTVPQKLFIRANNTEQRKPAPEFTLLRPTVARIDARTKGGQDGNVSFGWSPKLA
jgi:hypothetical protein